MKKDNISRIAVFHNASKRILNVFLCGWIFAAVIHQDQHVVLRKALAINQVSLDIFHIIVTSTQLTLLAWDIITKKKLASSFVRNKNSLPYVSRTYPRN
jgi:hypothetical protein